MRKINFSVFVIFVVIAISGFSYTGIDKTQDSTKSSAPFVLTSTHITENLVRSSAPIVLKSTHITENPVKSSTPFVSSSTDNLITGAKYNPYNINAIWSESFDGATFPPTGWANIQESGTAAWNRYTAGSFPVCSPHSGAGMSGFNIYYHIPGVSSLVSPVFSLTAGSAKLGFWMYRDAGYNTTNADRVDYMINTFPSTGATLLGTINRSKTLAPVETGPDGWYYYEFAIPGTYNTAINYIILKGTSALGNNCYVDDIAVSYLPANDVGMVSVDVPGQILSEPNLIPKATVKNFGYAVQTFPVTMTITPGNYSSTQTVTALSSFESLQVPFALWNPSEGTYSVKVVTQLGTDQDRSNDTLQKTILVSNTFLAESFDSETFPPTGWVKIQEDGSTSWKRYTSGSNPPCSPHSGAGLIEFESHIIPIGISSLVSRVFSLTAGTSKLGFWMYRDSGYPAQVDKVDYMINTSQNSTGATLLGTINRCKTLAPVETGPDGWYYYQFTIPGTFNTATNYIILKGTSAFGNNIHVDDVSVSFFPVNDVGMVSVDVPGQIVPGTTLIPKATVKNFGSAVQTFPVTMTITPGGYTSTQTVTALSSSGSLQVSFPSWNPGEGTYTVKVVTQLGTDQYRTNDTLQKTILVINAKWPESFDTATFPPAGWTKIQESGLVTWSRYTAGAHPPCSPHSGAGLSGFNSFSTYGVSSLVSPVFSLTAGTAKLGFWMYRDVGYPAIADRIECMINTSPNSTGAFSLGIINRCKTLAPVETGFDGWYYYDFVIPGTFNTSANYIILKAAAGFTGNDCYVDDVAVSYLLANDVGMVSVDVSGQILPGTLIPKATVKNFGTLVQTFPVTMTITPGNYTSTQTVSDLQSFASLQVPFASWNPAPGTYSVKVVTQSGTDQNRTNDTLQKTIIVTYASWASGTVIPSATFMGSAVSYMRNDSAWLICTGGNAPNLTSTLIYNFRTNSWFTGAPLISGNDLQAMAILKDTAYIMGGYGTISTPTTIFEKYNIRTNTWTAGTPLPSAIGWAKAVGYQDSLIYLAGGYDGAAHLSAVSLYNSNTNSWRAATPMPAGVFGGAFARTGDTLVYICGADIIHTVNTTYRGVISQTDRSVIAWTSGTPYPAGPMYRFDAAGWMPGKIIVGGGSPSGDWYPATPGPAYIYNPATDTWTPLPYLTVPVLGAFTGSVKYNNSFKFALAGGYNGSTAVTNVQIYTDDVLTGISKITTEIPKEYNLSQNYPNPFNPSTKINFALPKSGFVSLKIYDILGREVRTLVNEVKSAGQFSVVFNGSELSSGVYFYKLSAGEFESVKRMVMIK